MREILFPRPFSVNPNVPAVGHVRDNSPNQQDFARQLLPPSLRLTSLRDSTAFLADIDRLRRQLERDRKEEPAADQSGADFDDD